MEEEITIDIGDTLPTYYDFAVHVFSKATRPGSAKMNKVIFLYTKTLLNIWTKAFGFGHAMARKNVMKRLEKVVKSYYNSVYAVHYRKNNVKSLRILNKEWKAKVFIYPDITYSELLDIGKDMGSLTGDEERFYIDQKTTRGGRISEEVDDKYQAEIERSMAEQALEEEMEQQEDPEMVLNSTAIDMEASILFNNQSQNRSGLVRLSVPTNEMSTQTDVVPVDRPKIRVKAKICTDEIKATCATVSAVCNLSAEMARLAVQTVCKHLYGHDFLLTPPTNETDSTDEEPKEKKPRMPVTSTEYEKYALVLPSPRTITDYKQMQASQAERDAANKLLMKEAGKKCTLHYDTTSRNKIDGEWPAIIFGFSSGEEFVLRPLFFAYEDRQQIADLLVETYHRLSIAASVSSGKDVSAKYLWERTDAIMTDSVEKNLKIENIIAVALDSKHIPLHLLCKSHTVEKLDATNLLVLSRIESSVKQREILEKINPALKSFFRSKKTTVEAGIDALVSLVSHDKSGKSSNVAQLFDHICEREGVTKRIFLYQERRFAKLGKSAAALVEAYQILRMVLDETHTSNQLVDSCLIYMESELFLSELRALAYFNYSVTFPFLYFVQLSSQTELLKTLPQLYQDLLAKKTDTLKNFTVPLKRIHINEPTDELGKHLIGLMCVEAAEGVMQQCGREYGFAVGEHKERASDISKLSEEQRHGLPSNNLSSERNLSVFDNRAEKSAKCCNYKFTAKSIRNDMMLYKGEQGIVEPSSKKLTRLLNEKENRWNEHQLELAKIRIEQKLAKAVRSKNYTRSLLNECKSWSGPFTSTEEMFKAIKERPDRGDHILRTEISYLSHTQKADKLVRPELYKINSVPFEEKLENLSVLLFEDNPDASTTSLTDLPTNYDVLKSIRNVTTAITESVPPKITSNEFRAVAWRNKDNTYFWFIGFVTDSEDDEANVDHLHPLNKNSLKAWKYPVNPDVCRVVHEQILNVVVMGEWSELGTRRQNYIVHNEKAIVVEFKRFCDNI